MMKDILLLVENSAHANPVIIAGVKMAERIGAQLTIQILTSAPAFIPALAPMTTMYVPEWAMADDQAERIRLVSDMVAGSTASVRVLGLHDGVFAIADRVGRTGPIADLIVIGGEDHWQTHWLRHNTSETIVMSAGTPLLVLAGGDALPPVRKVVIGWKDSPEARRAVHDLIALAEPAAKVTVVTVGGFADEARVTAQSAAEIVRHLIGHGLHAEWKAIRSDEFADAEALEAFALEDGADLLVIGAFAHSRFREVIFGGFTRSLLDKSRLPILFSR